jgi:hypothetical protein
MLRLFQCGGIGVRGQEDKWHVEQRLEPSGDRDPLH